MQSQGEPTRHKNIHPPTPLPKSSELRHLQQKQAEKDGGYVCFFGVNNGIHTEKNRKMDGKWVALGLVFFVGVAFGK